MARLEPDRPLLPSVIDRLIDDEPEIKTEPPESAHQVLRELRLAVRRDLENLLNARQRALSWPPGLAALDRSAMNYGIPDFTGKSLLSIDARNEFLRSIERIVRTFEPRFKNVRVLPATDADPRDRTLRFRIEAVLRAEPVPESIVFDSSLEPVSRAFEVSL
jgi:type VI secretion system protein ImpF